MADEAAALEEYKVQLEQVEAALAAESSNEELKKLKFDLEEVIALTQELIYSNATSSKTAESGTSEASTPLIDLDSDKDSDDEFTESLTKPLKDWKAGDTCLAKSKKDGRYHEAVIKSITYNEATVQFIGVQTHAEVNKLVQLRFVEPKNPWSKSKKNQFQVDREKRKKKREKKALRIKELEAAKETEKNKWKQFTTKAAAKQLKGVKRQSIFASPESVAGKVGVGTCGVAGKNTTKTSAPKGYIKSQGGYH